jgi:hypothetical protein
MRSLRDRARFYRVPVVDARRALIDHRLPIYEPFGFGIAHVSLLPRGFFDLLLLHQAGDFERQDSLEGSRFDFLKDPLFAEEIINRASVMRVVNFFRLCCGH